LAGSEKERERERKGRMKRRESRRLGCAVSASANEKLELEN